jgi:hypothetical protein
MVLIPLLVVAAILSAVPTAGGAVVRELVDSPGPVVTVPANVAVEATSASGAAVTFAASAVDGTGAPLDPTCTPASGSTFSLGPTTVTCTATDASGMRGSANFIVTVVDTTPPSFTSTPPDVTAEATGPSGATVSFTTPSATDAVDPSPSVTCDQASGSVFKLGQTTVTCTASDAAGNKATTRFSVFVRDTTPPTIAGVAGQTQEATGAGTPISFATPSTTDTVDPSPTVTCAARSGSLFPVGRTPVTCIARDASGNSASTSFTVTIVDTTPPTFAGAPSSITLEASGPGGAVVSYTVPAASDIADPAPSVSCTPPPGTTFPNDPPTTTVTCTARDASGNSATTSFTVTVRDTTAPVLTLPGDITSEATSGSGTSISYAVSASDAVTANPTVSCDRSAGSTFPLGSTRVNCTAKDAAGNTSTGSFNVNVVDTTPPSLQAVPPDATYEAGGPSGAVATYTVPTANDAVDGPLANVSCSPKSGSTFALGTTTVTCSATDAHGNTGNASFRIRIVDTTPPVINAPAEFTVAATTTNGTPATNPSIAAVLNSVRAIDMVDGARPVTNDAPAFLPVGRTVVTFAASDTSGNKATATMHLTVKPLPVASSASSNSTTTIAPAAAPPPDLDPPDEVANLKAVPGDGSIGLGWSRPTAADFDHVVVTRTDATGTGPGAVVYTGSGTSVVDTTVENGVTYRYVVVSYDHVGNRSAGVAVIAAATVSRGVKPAVGAVVRHPPVLHWAGDPKASYYNVQLYRNGAKILSAWPKQNKITLKHSWRYNGSRVYLTPGTYFWYVWPGYGNRTEHSYGELLVLSTFVVTR